jgi:amino-acid N-acetyltransferase
MNAAGETIRSAEFEDAEAIFRLIKAHPEELVPRPLSDIVQNIDRFVVCERDGQVVGCVSWQILPEIGVSQQHDVEIVSLSIDASCQGRGVGRRLVEQAIERIKPLRPSEILVLTFTPGFFGKLGFRPTPKEDLVHKIYMGCINCTKYDSPYTCPEVAMKLVPASPGLVGQFL